MGYHFSKDQRRGPKPGARNFLLSSWCDSSSEVGLKDWFYVLCNTCPRKVQSSKDKYWCEHCKKVEFNGAFKYVGGMLHRLLVFLFFLKNIILTCFPFLFHTEHLQISPQFDPNRWNWLY
ncbi:hypothetical protein S245_040461 [Arachis hypogaea]